jgi:hypothetical protein
MKKIITFGESELINMIKTIVEQVNQDLNQYDENDFVDVFISLFRNWIGNKLGEEVKRYPFSYLLNKFGQEFLEQTFGDKYEKYFGNNRNISFRNIYDISTFGRRLIEIGAYVLPSLRQEKKFTERFGKIILFIIEALELPSFARLELTEDKPYDIVATLYIDYPSYLKSEESSIRFSYHNPIQARLKSLLENFLGVEFGNPVHGKINLTFSVKLENEDEWVKKVLNKEIKKHIKQMPDGNYVHSIRFEPKLDKSNMKIVYKENSSRRMHQYEFRNKVQEYLKGLGYTKIHVENI